MLFAPTQRGVFYCHVSSMTKVIMTFGSFDDLREEHVWYLKQARSHGDLLVTVILANDVVQQIKGKIPQQSVEQRRDAVKTLGILGHEVVTGSRDEFVDILKTWSPAVIVLGYTQDMFLERIAVRVDEVGCKVDILRLDAYSETK